MPVAIDVRQHTIEIWFAGQSLTNKSMPAMLPIPLVLTAATAVAASD